MRRGTTKVKQRDETKQGSAAVVEREREREGERERRVGVRRRVGG